MEMKMKMTQRMEAKRTNEFFIKDIIRAFGKDNEFGEIEIHSIMGEMGVKILHSQVHQICLKLHLEGLIRRYKDFSTIWVNEKI